MHQKKAASVLPLPVGAVIRVWRPAATSREPRSWTSVGAAKAAWNQSRAGAEKSSSAGFIADPSRTSVAETAARGRPGARTRSDAGPDDGSREGVGGGLG